MAFDKNVSNNIPKQLIDDSLSNSPTLEEVKKAIKTLKNNKVAGLDGMPAEVYQIGGDLLQHQLHQLLVKIWANEDIPITVGESAIITIYKGKGDRSDCGNYRGISLSVTAGKILARIMNSRLKSLPKNILPATQTDFRPLRGTIDMIFTMHQLQEKCREQLQSLYTASIDLTKTFHSVSRKLLWDVLSIYECLDFIALTIKNFLWSSKISIKLNQIL